MVTGHGYLDRMPLVLGAGLAVALVALVVAVLDASRGREARALPAWAFALLAPLAFAFQEILELSLRTGTFAWHGVAAPTFLPGIALQLPFSLLAWLAARLLLRAAGQAGRALASPPPAPPVALLPRRARPAVRASAAAERPRVPPRQARPPSSRRRLGRSGRSPASDPTISTKERGDMTTRSRITAFALARAVGARRRSRGVLRTPT